jgi:uncharacterized membrane protein YgcG
MYAAEVAYRMNGLHRIYPYWVTTDMVSRWVNHTQQGQVIDWNAARDFQMHTPEVRQGYASQGSHGAISGFGGGSSFGGGGSGSSW